MGALGALWRTRFLKKCAQKKLVVTRIIGILGALCTKKEFILS